MARESVGRLSLVVDRRNVDAAEQVYRRYCASCSVVSVLVQYGWVALPLMLKRDE